MSRAAKFSTVSGQDRSKWSHPCPLTPPNLFKAVIFQFLIAFSQAQSGRVAASDVRLPTRCWPIGLTVFCYQLGKGRH